MIKTQLGAQRFNNRMAKVWDKAIEAKQKYCLHDQGTYVEDWTKIKKCNICGANQ